MQWKIASIRVQKGFSTRSRHVGSEGGAWMMVVVE